MRFFPYFNLSVLLLIAITAVSFFFIKSKQKNCVEQVPLIVEDATLPKNPFAQKKESYEDWEKDSLSLRWVGPKLSLPNLSSEIVFYGKNLRPDVANGKSKFYVGVSKTGVTKAVLSGDKIYLKYTKNGFEFSESQTPLWLEMSPTTDPSGLELLECRSFLKDEDNNLITLPIGHHLFTLKAQEKKINVQEIGGFRADSSLLIRQGARLSGPDLFFEMHGGEEFKETKQRERLDFLAVEPNYFCFVKEGDFLIWKENRWQRPLSNENSENSPLIHIKKMDDKAIAMELWDLDGKQKVPLSILRAKNYDPPLDLTQEFKIVGAKTWVECIVECRSKRFILKEGDWVLLKENGWEKLSTEEEVDNYVNQKTLGPLFVLDKIMKKNGRTVIQGHLFNALRTTATVIELTSSLEASIKTEVTQ